MRMNLVLLLPICLMAVACVSVSEYRELEREVNELKRANANQSRERVADLGVQIDALNQRLTTLEGRMEATEHEAGRAMAEAQRARRDASRGFAGPVSGPTGQPPAGGEADPDGGPLPGSASLEEVNDYRAARAAWRGGDLEGCIDRFRSFLQTYPSSAYADDAAYWMADCHFKQGDYRTAILRFDDVVARYPDSDRSADALYRQGEALLRLGPGYSKAAGKAFERVIAEYPDSPRAAEARRQLDLLGSG
jgi:tol-pal system protein YbgF